jgi:succinate dehydrogenase/fumarate reductase flavoprotein subunit
MTQAEESFDIIVVGGGGSGLAAAVGAAKDGARVLLLEKNAMLRGSTGMSIGSITSTQTELQKRKGIIDHPDDHFRDMGVFAGPLAPRDNLEFRRILVDEVPETVRWLTSLGVVFFGPMPEPPHTKPRMHNIIPNSRAYIQVLAKECRRLGVKVLVNARVGKLLKEGKRVAGVEADVAGETQRFRARKAVILTSGDYNAGMQLRSQFTNISNEIDGVNINEGDGQLLGVAEGSEILNGDIVWGPLIRFLPPPRLHPLTALPFWRPLALFMRMALEHLPAGLLRPFVMSFVTSFIGPERSLFQEGAILINRNGQRFTEELDRPAYDVPLQPGKLAYILLGGEVVRKFTAWPYFVSTAPGVAYAYMNDYKRTRKDVYHEAPTLQALAGKIGIDPKALADGVAAYNKSLAGGEIKGRSDGVRPILDPPFCVLGPIESRVVITDGGLKVNTRHQVLRSDGSIVQGLFAAGAVGQGGLLLEGHGHHLAWAFTSGRRAGRFAAQEPTMP